MANLPISKHSPLSNKESSKQLYKKVGDEFVPYNSESDAFQLPSSGYWKVINYSDGRGEFKLLNIDASRPLQKLQILSNTTDVFREVSDFVYKSDDPSLFEIVEQTLLSLEKINSLKEKESN